ncbi:MAG: DUF2277 family protein [Gammaproteobacteria bacterium]|nr:DUF2277 family protein [Gammaproteobacteria bacterium]
MCRNIKVLYNFDPPADQQEIEACARARFASRFQASN